MRQEQAPAVSSSSHAGVSRGSTHGEGPLRAAGYRVVWLSPVIGAHSTRERKSASIVSYGRAGEPRSTCPPHTVALRHRRRFSQPPGPWPSAPPGFFKDRPSVSTHPVSTPAALRPLRHDAATRRARSVLAVPPRHDGFLHRGARGLVASRSRPWGSPGFRGSEARSRAVRPASSPVPALQSVSLPRSGAHVTVGPCPPAVTGRVSDPTSRPCSARESVATRGRCRPAVVRCSLGLLHLEPRRPTVPPVAAPRGPIRSHRRGPVDASTDRTFGPPGRTLPRRSAYVVSGRASPQASGPAPRHLSGWRGATATACRAGRGRRSLCASIPEGRTCSRFCSYVKERSGDRPVGTPTATP